MGDPLRCFVKNFKSCDSMRLFYLRSFYVSYQCQFETLDCHLALGDNYNYKEIACVAGLSLKLAMFLSMRHRLWYVNCTPRCRAETFLFEEFKR